MSDNKNVRKLLEQLYGSECFIEKLHLRKDDKPRKYKSKGQMKRMKQLTYHHILERRNGGKSTVENGAILSNENHTWFNKQSKEKQQELNQAFQDYKNSFTECRVTFVDEIDIPYTVKPIEFSIDLEKPEKYNRAKQKEETRRLSEDYIDR